MTAAAYSRGVVTSLLLTVSLAPALAGERVSLLPTSDGVISIHVGNARDCAVGCLGDWSGSPCAGLSGAVVSVYADGSGTAPLMSVVVDDGGWADFSGLMPGTYQWSARGPNRVIRSGRVDVQERRVPPSPVCVDGPSSIDDEGRIHFVRDCIAAYHRPLDLAERPWGSWLEVRMPAAVVGLRGTNATTIRAEGQQGTTYSSEMLHRLPH